jgi:hypothetical protein
MQDTRDGLTKANVNFLISGDVDEGVIVQDLTPITANKTPPTGDTPVDFTIDTVQGAQPITSNSVDAGATSTVTCPKPHNLVSTDKILISGVASSSPTINGTQTVTVVTPTTFTVPIDVTVPGTGGTFVKENSHSGGVGYIQATAYSGFTGVIGTIQHSDDDTSYADLIAFTNLTAIGKERKTVTGTVRRYLSSKVAVTGAGSITLFMGFCRK